MLSGRIAGRYNLSRLGWNAFEDLCMQVLRVALGETCTRFRTGPDGGRDGYYSGVACDKLLNQNRMNGDFFVQCKHSSDAAATLSLSTFSGELSKICALGTQHSFNYILLTNRRMSANAQSALQSTIEQIAGVERCLILAEEWIEDTIDAHAKLLRLVPRLYGIGDLSQIMSFSIDQQSQAVFEDLAIQLRTYVPTDSYRRAEHALDNHGFVVLTGPPAAGKSSIAAALCLVNLGQNKDCRVLKIEHADQFKNTWSPQDKDTVYWVDDVFGETTLDEPLLKEWSAALEKVEAARRRGAKIIFCTRDYILSTAETQLKQSKLDFLRNAGVRVDVTALSDSEREGILYNHVKEGDLQRNVKTALKPHLEMLSRLTHFTPELARRLGTARFHQGLLIHAWSLMKFFEEPVAHFKEVIQGLAPSEKAALAVCLFNNNAVADPIPESAVAPNVLQTFGVTVQQVRLSFEALEGSLVKRTRDGVDQLWQVHHPSMIEALQSELALKSSQMKLYLQAAKLSVILRDTTTIGKSPDTRRVFLPRSLFEDLAIRFATAPSDSLESIGAYICTKGADELVEYIANAHSSLIGALLALPSERTDVPVELALRLDQILQPGLFPHWRLIAEQSLMHAYERHACLDFLKIPGALVLFETLSRVIMNQEVNDGFPSFEAIYEVLVRDARSSESVDEIAQTMDDLYGAIDQTLDLLEIPIHANSGTLAYEFGRIERKLSDVRSEIEGNEAARDDQAYEDYRDARYERRFEAESSRFSDVDR